MIIKTHERLSFCDKNNNKSITTHSINLRLPITLDYLLKHDNTYDSTETRPEADDRQLIQVGIHCEGSQQAHTADKTKPSTQLPSELPWSSEHSFPSRLIQHGSKHPHHGAEVLWGALANGSHSSEVLSVHSSPRASVLAGMPHWPYTAKPIPVTPWPLCNSLLILLQRKSVCSLFSLSSPGWYVLYVTPQLSSH